MILLDGSLIAGLACVALAATYEGIALWGKLAWPPISAIVQKWTSANSFVAALIFYTTLAALAALFGHFMRWF